MLFVVGGLSGCQKDVGCSFKKLFAERLKYRMEGGNAVKRRK